MAVENPDTVKAFRDRLGGLPDDFPILVLPGIPAQEPTEIITAYQLTAADLRAPISVPAPEPRKATPVSTIDWINVRPTPDTTGAPVGKLYRGSTFMVVPTKDPNWNQLVDSDWPGRYVYAPLLSFP